MDKKKGSGGASKKGPVTRREKRSRTEMEADAAAAAANASSANVVSTSAIVPTTQPTSAPPPPSSSKSTLAAAFGNPFGLFPNGSSKQVVGTTNSGMRIVFPGSIPKLKKVASPKNAPPPSVPVPIPNDKVWSKVVPHLSRCTSAENIRVSSYYNSAGKTAAASSSTSRNNCLRRLLGELVALEDDLPSTMPNIWLRYDEETPQFMRCIITAPQGTPYALGMFAFDIYIPDSYPSQPPQMQLLTTGGGTIRFSPNLYQNGKVCLSLLGTWSGPKWDKRHSSLLQVLMSIQGLILGFEHPYYLEPGHGGWEGEIKNSAPTTASTTASTTTSTTTVPGYSAAPSAKKKTPASTGKAPAAKKAKTASTGAADTDKKNGTLFVTTPVVDSTQPSHVQTYEDRLRMGTIKYAMLDILKQGQNEKLSPRHYLYPFQDIILCHFYHCKESMIPTASIFANAMRSSSQRRGAKTAADELEKLLKAMAKPTAISLAEAASGDGIAADGDTKMSGAAAEVSKNGTVIESVIATKRGELEDAVSKQDYVSAGRLQTELQNLGDAAATTHSSIEQRIASKEQDMEAAAAVKDYITAGKLQSSLERLKKNKKVLQNLESRMFDAASKLDFVRAGRFQEQFQILLQQSEEASSDTTLGESLDAGKSKQPMFGPSGSIANAFASATSKFAATPSNLPSSLQPMMFSMGAPSFGPPPPLSASLPPPPVMGEAFFDDGYAFDDGYYGDY